MILRMYIYMRIVKGDKEDELQQYAKQLVNTVNTLKEEELVYR